MVSTFHGIETAKRGIFAQQTAINTTGHNVSNANTIGYSRQVVGMIADRSMEVPGINNSTSPGQLGSGVDIANIIRVRETYLDDQFRGLNSGYGEWLIREDTLSKIEAMVNEPGSQSLSSVLNDFWNSWSDLATQPDSLTARTVVIENAITLADSFNDLANKLSGLQENLANSLNIITNDSNTLLLQISSLNREITRLESLGNNANDLRDSRDIYVDKLSEYMNINVREMSNGYVITTGSTELVNGYDASLIDATALPADIQSGKMFGYQYSMNELAMFQSQLDELAKSVAIGEIEFTIPKGTIIPEGHKLTLLDDTELTFSGDITERTTTIDLTVKIAGLNGIHQLGYTLEDPPNGGEPFFAITGGGSDFTANNIKVNSNIASNVRKIATSSSVYLGADGLEHVAKGNNDLAVWIAGLRNYDISFNDSIADSPIKGNGTVSEYYNAMIGQLGVKSQEAGRRIDNNDVLLAQVSNSRLSVSGVSIDEEMANLVKFQQAYSASARMISTLDEMFDKLINGTGIVGR